MDFHRDLPHVVQGGFEPPISGLWAPRGRPDSSTARHPAVSHWNSRPNLLLYDPDATFVVAVGAVPEAATTTGTAAGVTNFCGLHANGTLIYRWKIKNKINK